MTGKLITIMMMVMLAGCNIVPGGPQPVVTGQIAFVSDRDGNPEIYLLNLSDSSVVQVTRTEEGQNLLPKWSPDGVWLSYLYEGDLFLTAVDSISPRRLTTGQEIGAGYFWSSSGRTIAFTSRENNPNHRYDLYWIDLETGTVHDWNWTDRNHRGPSPSLDGRYVAFVDYQPPDLELFDLYLLDDWSSGRETKLLDGIFPGISWSPDSQHIAFVRGKGSDNAQLMTVWVNDGSVTQLTHFDEGWAGYPAWSPDGRKIAFLYKTSSDSSLLELYLIGSDASDLRSAGMFNAASDLTWSPDSVWLVFTCKDGGNRDLYIIGADGQRMRSLDSNPGKDADPTWRPTAQ